MFNSVDKIIDKITMYRLVLYYLIALLIFALVLSLFNILTFSPLNLIGESIFLIIVCWASNKLFSKIFNAPTNIESLYITALILALVITPPTNFWQWGTLFWAGVLAMGSKYIFAINKKHIFNPVAIAIFLTSVVLSQSATWWVGNAYMATPVLLGGFLIMRKTRKEDMVFAFLTTAIVTTFILTFGTSVTITTTLSQITLHSSLFFLTFAMLTEPYTLPSSKKSQIIYAVIVAILFTPQFHIGDFYFTPEMALLVGNIFAYIVSPKYKFVLNFSKRIKISSDSFDFVFNLPKKMNFLPGQYMEFTFPHSEPDSRGNRRYFTLANSPTENTLRLGIKFNENGSTFKQSMLKATKKSVIVGAQLSGDFVLPKDKSKKIAFIAGGIGITPFRSILKYLIDTNEKRDIAVLFANKRVDEIVYTDVLNEAWAKLGIRTAYTISNPGPEKLKWKGHLGRIDDTMIKTKIPDYLDRVFYISGPHAMVEGSKSNLKKLGVKGKNIIVDFFPGLA